jgi:hypothetical protein
VYQAIFSLPPTIPVKTSFSTEFGRWKPVFFTAEESLGMGY